ncbi:MAG: TetR/AcrR family transcriptional regulator [Firmicutes bacterium]|nr:TetR/AcrR family transcriptional regulator [Bacillota bacterium]
MPTEAFYKLEPAKKEQILASAIHEFSELPYEKVSIFKIAQNAEVSRSGFYYYFKDKRDIYEYIIYELKCVFLEKYDLQNGSIDIFKLCENIFDYIVSFKNTTWEAFFRKVVSNMNADDLKTLFSFMDMPDHSCEIECTMDGIKFESVDQLKGTVMFLATSIMFSVAGYMDDEYDLEAAEGKLHNMLDIIRFGIIKGEKI